MKKLSIKIHKKPLKESKDIRSDFLRMDSGETDKGINKTFDVMMRTKYFDEYQILHRDGAGFLDKPIPGLLRKYWRFTIKYKSKEGKWVPPRVWLDDIKKGELSFFRQWNNKNITK